MAFAVNILQDNLTKGMQFIISSSKKEGILRVYGRSEKNN